MEHIHGKPGRLVELRKADIMVPEYQRPVDWSRVKKCASQFNWYLFGTLYVAYRSPDYFIVDGRNRLEMARLRPELDMVPCMVFDFDGPQHEAEIFVELQRYRKPLVTKDMHSAELFAAGEFGAVARVAEDFVLSLEAESVPLASIRKLVKAKPEAFARVAPLVGELVGQEALAKDFIEALIYLEDETGLVAERWKQLLLIGYEHLLTGMMHYQAAHMAGRFAKFASPKQKAAALRAVIEEAPADHMVTVA